MISRRDVLKGAAAGGLWIAGGRQADAWGQFGSAPARRRRRPPASGSSSTSTRSSGPAGTAIRFPGPSMPSGMVQLSPDSGKQGWDWCAGYHYSDTAIAGFSHTHLSGTGIGDLCDILVTPTMAGAEMPADVTSPFSHEREKASAGYYAVDLLAYEIRAELTATRRVGCHRYSFLRPSPGKQPAVVFDLGFAINGDQPVETQLTIEGPTTISGYRFSKGWAADQRVYFVARFYKPIMGWLLGADGDYSAERRAGEGDEGARPVQVRAAARRAAAGEGGDLAGERRRRAQEPRARGARLGVRHRAQGRGRRLGAQAPARADRDARQGAQDGVLHGAVPRAARADGCSATSTGAIAARTGRSRPARSRTTRSSRCGTPSARCIRC